MRSKFFNLNWRDFFKGLAVAIATAVITSLYQKITEGKLFDIETLKAAGVAGLAALLAYLLKNLITNSQGQIATPE
jgi:ABC-type Fe3+-siderophore transport system permease subunit